MLAESKRAYLQLDETYKTMIDRLKQEKVQSNRLLEKGYQAQIQNLEDQLKQIKEQNEDYRRKTEALEAQKIDQKLDFDTKLYNIEK